MTSEQQEVLGTEPSTLPEAEMRAQYVAYRARQARGLVRILPREAVRPLYRSALRHASVEAAPADPLAALLTYCERLLPLPPFEVWLEDVRRHAIAHLYDLDSSAGAPTADAPMTVQERTFGSRGRSWTARLRSFRDGEAWRGYIDFEDVETRCVNRTAVIFREADPVEVRERFLGFDDDALQAFLRSALP